jgi:hypothetical protein
MQIALNPRQKAALRQRLAANPRAPGKHMPNQQLTASAD